MTLKYFKLSEFDCPTEKGSGSKMHPDTLAKLDKAREYAGIPFKINRGFSTPLGNKNAKGVADSPHLVGRAADIDLPNSVGSRQRFLIVAALIKAGFNRIGIANGFIHADDDPTKDKNVIWLY
jgi:hypothetical protein